MPPSRARWLPVVLAAVAVVAMQCGSALTSPLTRQVGSVYSEAPGHLWGLWTTAQGLFEHGPYLRVADVAYPEGYARHLMDVSNLLFFLPGYWLAGGGAAGASLGWNLVHGGSVLVGALGIALLGRRLFGDEPGAIALAILVFCASPFLLQHPSMGRTEYLPALWLPLFLALFHRWMRRPVDGVVEARPPVWVGIAAGGVLAAVVLGGWYVAAFAALLAPFVAIAWSRGLRVREAVVRVLVVTTIAALPAIPALLALFQGSAEGKTAGFQDMRLMPASPLLSQVRGEDMERLAMHMGQPAYVGLAALALAVVGAIGAPRKATGWLALGIWAFVLGAGPVGRLGGEGPGMGPSVAMPAIWVVELLPALGAIKDWGRIAVVGALPLAIGAGWGFLALARWSRAPGPVLLSACALVLVDQATYPKRWSADQPWFDATAPSALIEGLATLPAGPVVMLPIDIQHRATGGAEVRGLGFLWQLQHGRPIPGLPEGRTDTTIAHSYLSRLAIYRQELSVMLRNSLDSSVPPATTPPPPNAEEIRCARLDAADLRARGYVGVAVTTSLTGGADLGTYVAAILGEPAFQAGPAWVWDLARAPAGEGAPCELPLLTERLDRDQRAAAH